MNRCFRVVWNAANAAWQAVAETAPAGGKTKSSSRLQRRSAAFIGAAALAVAVPGSWAQSLPTGGNIVAGSGSIATSGSTMTITQNTAKLAADWQSFNIGQGNTVNFVQPSASAVALNRVLGSDVSVIQGALNANGQVFLLNPNGVLFTPTAQVNVGGIVASTLSLSTSDFLAGNYNFAGSSSNAVVNQGNITAVGDGGKGGTIALIAAKITNDGNLTANGGNVLLGAGSEVMLDLGGPVKLQVKQGAIDALVSNGGAIQADGGMVYLTAQAVNELTSATINNTGVIRAQTLATGEKGEILLLADMKVGTVNVGGTLDASAPNGGDGGFVETSGAVFNVGDTAVVTTRAVNGATGTWLIDPDVLEIVASGGGSIPGVGVGTSQISTSTLNTALGSNNVNLQANNWINFKTAFTYSGVSDTTLGLYAPTIMLGGDISTDTNKLSLNFGGTYASVNYSGDVYVYGGDRSITTKGGDVTFNGNLGSDNDSVNARNRNLTVNTQSVTTSGKITHKGLVNGGFNVIASQTGDLSFTLSGLSNKWVNFEFSTGSIHVYTDATKGTEVTKIGADVWPLTMVVGGSQLSGGVDIPAGTVMNLNATFGATGTVYFMDGTSSTFTMNNGSGGNAGWTPATALTNVARIEYLGQNSSAAPYNFPGVTYNTTGPAGKLNNYVARGGVAQVDNSIAVNGGITFEASRFVNNVGSTALQPGTGKFWQVWSTNTDPYDATTGDVMGGLAYGFKQYGATYGTTSAAETGKNGYFLSISPTVTLEISTAQTKVYDGTNAATLAATDFAVGNGVVGKDVVALVTASLPTSGTYNSANVVDATTVSATVGSSAITATEVVGTSTVNVYGYTLDSTASGKGTITPKTVTASVIGTPTKTYDATTAATLTSANYSVSGFLGSDGATVTETVGTYNSANVVDANTVNVTLANNDLSATGTTLLSNYTVVTSASGAGAITPAPLGIYATPTYNGTDSFSVTGGTGNGTGTVTTGGSVKVAGLVNGEKLAGFTLDDANVLKASLVEAVSLADGKAASNYVLNTGVYGTVGSAAAGTTSTSGGVTTTANTTNIAAMAGASLGVSVVGTYNGTTGFDDADTGTTIETNGLVNGETLTAVTVKSPNVFVNGDNYVTAFTGGTASLANYAIQSGYSASTSGSPATITKTNNTATINRAPLGVTVSGTYNGTTTLRSADGATITGYGLVGQDAAVSLSTATLDSKNVANATKVLSLTGTGTFDQRNYVLDGSVNTTPATAGTALDGSGATNTAMLGKAALGVSVTGTYNGTTGFDDADTGTTIEANGLVNGETLTAVTVSSPNVFANGANYVTAFTGGTASLANYAIQSGYSASTSGSPATITKTNNTATINRAPLGVTVSGTYNGTTTLNAADGATITGYGLVGQDVAVSLSTATLDSKNVANATKVLSLTGTGTFDQRNYVLDGSVNTTPATAGTALDGSGATNTATLARLAITVEADDKSKKTGESDPTLTYQIISGNLIGDDSLGSLNRNAGENPGQYTINATALANGNYAITAIDGVLTVISDFLPPPPPSPIIVPAFVDNGSAVLANQSITSFGGLNYVLSGSSLTSVSSAGSATGATGGAQQTTSATSSQNAVTSSTSSGDGATQGLSGTGGEQTGQDASFLNFVASNNSGDGAQGNGNEGGDRKSASELNVNNVTVPSSTGPLDVFVVDTGINLQRIAQLRGLTN
jgi:filamentous hemagglutinin family protein